MLHLSGLGRRSGPKFFPRGRVELVRPRLPGRTSSTLYFPEMHAAEQTLAALARRWETKVPPRLLPLLAGLLRQERAELLDAVRQVLQAENEGDAFLGDTSPLSDLVQDLARRIVGLSPALDPALAQELAPADGPADYVRAPRRLDDVREILRSSMILATGRCLPLAAVTEAMRAGLRNDHKGEGRLQLNRDALRRAMGSPTLAEAESSGGAKATGRPTVDAGRMWTFMTTSMYRDADLPVIATREALQNGVDAIRAAVRAGKLGRRDGRFMVIWDPEQRALIWDDNGLGMDADTIFAKFLSLGTSGKSGATDSGEATGGFGVAKAVILGVSSTFRWRMHTRDNLAESRGLGEEVQVFDAPLRPGLQLTVFDVPGRYDSQYVYAQNRSVPILDRLRQLLGANDLPDITITLNGDVVPPLFPRSRGTKIPFEGSWGEGTTVVIKGYRRPPGDRGGAYYVRLGGLFQFAMGGRDLKMDVVVDVTTTTRPGAPGYPLNAARDSFQGRADFAFSDLRAEVEQETRAAARSEEDEVYEPDSDDAEIREETERITEAVVGAMEDPTIQAAIRDATHGLVASFAEMQGRRAAFEGTAPVGAQEDRLAPAATLPASLRTADSQLEAAVPGSPAGAAVELISALTELDSNAPQDSTTRVVTEDVRATVDRMGQGTVVDESDIRVLRGALGRAAEQAIAPGGSGIVQLAAVTALTQKAIDKARLTPAAQAQAKTLRSPFGSFAGLRISKKFDRRRAAAFRRNYAKWFPHLTIWDSILRLIADETKIRRRFKPGFILDDEHTGLTASGKGPAVVYVNPDRFAEIVKAHRERPLTIAGILHSIAVHELAHLNGRMGHGHDEDWVLAREDLGAATIHLLPAFAVLIQRILRLPARPTDEQRQIAKLEKRLERGQIAKGATLLDLRRELAAARNRVAEVEAAAAAARQECAESCARCRNAAAREVTPEEFANTFVGTRAIYLQARHAILHGEPEGRIAELHRALRRYARELGALAIACATRRVEGMRRKTRNTPRSAAHQEVQLHGFRIVRWDDVPFWTLNMYTDAHHEVVARAFAQVGRSGSGYDWTEVVASQVHGDNLEWDPEFSMFAVNGPTPETLEPVARVLRRLLDKPGALERVLQDLPAVPEGCGCRH